MTGLLLAAALAAAPAPGVGAAVAVDRPTAGPVVALLADVRVDSEVVGDVVAVGGDVELAPGSVVRGDVVALGGRVYGPGAVSGRVAAVGGLGLGLGGRTPRGDAASAWGFVLLRTGAWVVMACLALLAVPGAVRSAATQVATQRWRALVVGALALLVWLAVVVLALAVTGSPLGVACVLTAVALLLATKVVGLAAIAWVLGEAVAPRLPPALRGESARTGLAMLALALAGAVPVAGEALWLTAGVVGIGAAVGAALLRRPLPFLLPRFAAR